MNLDRSTLRIAPLVAAALLLSSLAASSATAQAGLRGPLFIVGGGTQPKALVQEFVKLASTSRTAHIVVFGMASINGLTSGEAKAEDFRKLGARAQNIWVTRAQADLDSVVHLLDSATGVWFGGGDQNRLLAALRGSKLEKAMLSLVLADAPHLGAGIDEGTALIVESSGLWRIMGASTVLIVDARDATRTGANEAVLGASGVRMHLLPDGATFDSKSGKATLLQSTRK